MNRLVIVFLLGLSLMIVACEPLEEPNLASFTPLEIVDINADKVSLKASVTYQNNNPVGGKLEHLEVKVYGNDVLVSTIDEELAIDIKPNTNFEVPIVINVPVKDLLKTESGLIGGLINSLLTKKVKVKYEGSATVNFAKVSFKLPIDKEEEVTIKL